MRRKVFFRTMAAALCGIITLLPAAAQAANKAVLLDASAGVDIIDAETDFAKGTDGWKTLGGTAADIADGAVKLSGSGTYGMSTDIGKSFYRNSSNEDGLYWDFETENDHTEDATLNSAADVGKWTSVQAGREVYTEPVENTELYNVGYKESGGTAANIIKADNGVTETVPAKGSTRCLTVMNPKSLEWSGYMGARVRLSSDNLKAGESYTLKFWFTQNSQQRPIYFGLTPYADDELSVNTKDALRNGVVNYQDAEHNRVAVNVKRQWDEYSVKFTPSAEDFSADGYTTLWIVTTAQTITNVHDIFRFEKMYLDNISLTHNTDGEKTTEYTVTARLRGEAGKKVSVAAEIDGTDELFTAEKTFEKDSEWEDMSYTFRVSSDSYFLSGEAKGSPFDEDNSRVKLTISSSEGDGFDAAYLHVIKRLGESDVFKYGGKRLYFVTDVIGLEKIDAAKGVCKIGYTKLANEDISVERGLQRYILSGTMPSSGGSGGPVFDITENNRTVFEKEYTMSMLFINGNNIYPSIDAVKHFGAGQYLVEFSVEGGTAEDTATASIGGVRAECEIFENGVGLAEITLTESDIAELSDTDTIKVDCDKTVSDITVKKSAN